MRILLGYNVACARRCRSTTLPFSLANDLEVCYWNKAASRWYQRVAGFIPVGVVLATDDMEKVAFGECQLLFVVRIGLIVIERFDDLWVEPIELAASTKKHCVVRKFGTAPS